LHVKDANDKIVPVSPRCCKHY